jgi:hypothetical protein
LLDILAGFVNADSDPSAPLRARAAHGNDKIAFALEGLGVARVESIEELRRQRA